MTRRDPNPDVDELMRYSGVRRPRPPALPPAKHGISAPVDEADHSWVVFAGWGLASLLVVVAFLASLFVR